MVENRFHQLGANVNLPTDSIAVTEQQKMSMPVSIDFGERSSSNSSSSTNSCSSISTKSPTVTKAVEGTFSSSNIINGSNQLYDDLNMLAGESSDGGLVDALDTTHSVSSVCSSLQQDTTTTTSTTEHSGKGNYGQSSKSLTINGLEGRNRSPSDSSSTTTTSNNNNSYGGYGYVNNRNRFQHRNGRSSYYNYRGSNYNPSFSVGGGSILANNSVGNNNNANGGPETNNTFELDGQVKYRLKDPLQMPDFVFRTMSQVLRHQGRPWVPELRNFVHDYKEPRVGLSAELEAYYNYMKPRVEEDVMRRATYFAITRSIKKIPKFPIDGVKYYGSFSSGTYLPLSDIDIVVYTRTDQVIEMLSWIATRMFADGIIHKSCQIITQSRIPLLKFYDSFTGFQINITVNTPYVMDRADYIKANIKADSPQIKLLYFLKFYLLQKNQNQVFHGGIGSYALSLMVIRYFQTNEVKSMVMEQKHSSTLLADLLLGFLELYGDTDFVRKHIISVSGHGDYIPVEQQQQHRYYNHQGYHMFNHADPRRSGASGSILMIEDHKDPHKNVSIGSYKAEAILNGFKVVHAQLTKNDHDSAVCSYINNVFSVVDSFDSYRRIISLQFEKYFKHLKINHVSNICFEDYINTRNTFGNRDLTFIFDKSDDTSFEVNIMGQYQWIGQSQQPSTDSMSVSNDYRFDCNLVHPGYGYSTMSSMHTTSGGNTSHFDVYVDNYIFLDYEQHVTSASDILFSTLSQAIISARQEDMTKNRLQQQQQEYHYGGGGNHSSSGPWTHRGYINNSGAYYNSMSRSYQNHNGNNNSHYRNGGGSVRYNHQNNHYGQNSNFSYYSNGGNFGNNHKPMRPMQMNGSNLRNGDMSGGDKQQSFNGARRKIVKNNVLNNNDANCPNLEKSIVDVAGGNDDIGVESITTTTGFANKATEADKKKRKKSEDANTSKTTSTITTTTASTSISSSHSSSSTSNTKLPVQSKKNNTAPTKIAQQTNGRCSNGTTGAMSSSSSARTSTEERSGRS